MLLRNVRLGQKLVTRFVWASSLATLTCCASANSATAQARPAEPLPPPNLPSAVAAPTPAAIPIYGVADCVRIGFEKQPALAAARASLAAREASRNGLAQTSDLACLFVPDLKVRKAQSLRGVDASQAQVLQVEAETTYAITRTYYTALYARMQFDVATEVVENLKFYRNLVQDIIKGGGDRDINQGTLDRLNIYLNLATTKQIDSEEGIKRALAALREAMGVGLECTSFQLADLRLPEPTIVPEKCDVVNLALSRRGELISVLMAADVTRLEIDAQGKYWFRPVVRTFASGGDIHSQPVPAGVRNGDYRPGAIAPEMPVSLAGKRDARVNQAYAYSTRAEAVVAKTRELIALEAEDGYLKWLEASRKVAASREAAVTARRLSKQTREDANKGGKVKQDEILVTDVMAGQATAAYQEALFQQVVALAGLERITSGGFQSGLVK